MIDRNHALPIAHQAKIVGIGRGAVYNVPRLISESEFALMRRIDELHLEHSFMGARMLRRELAKEGVEVGRPHIDALMRRMNIDALAPQPGTSKSCPRHTIYPYLLRHTAITRANPVWALDTTYIATAKGFVYLTAVIDVTSRRVLAHKTATTLEACHAVEIVEQAFANFGTAKTINTEHGIQFTASEFAKAVFKRGCKPSMDGRGAWRDNVFVERRWRSVKYERVYLRAYDTVSQARGDIAE